MHPVMIVGALAGAGAMIGYRMREAARPVTARRIVIPPLGMATGLSMFVYPPTRVPLWWAACALALGALVFAEPLILTSRLRTEGAEIMVRRSPAFLWTLLGLVAARFALRSWIELYVAPLQTGALFYLLAFGAVVRWRITMLRDYRRLRAALESAPHREPASMLPG